MQRQDRPPYIKSHQGHDTLVWYDATAPRVNLDGQPIRDVDGTPLYGKRRYRRVQPGDNVIDLVAEYAALSNESRQTAKQKNLRQSRTKRRGVKAKIAAIAARLDAAIAENDLDALHECRRELSKIGTTKSERISAIYNDGPSAEENPHLALAFRVMRDIRGRRGPIPTIQVHEEPEFQQLRLPENNQSRINYLRQRAMELQSLSLLTPRKIANRAMRAWVELRQGGQSRAAGALVGYLLAKPHGAAPANPDGQPTSSATPQGPPAIPPVAEQPGPGPDAPTRTQPPRNPQILRDVAPAILLPGEPVITSAPPQLHERDQPPHFPMPVAQPDGAGILNGSENLEPLRPTEPLAPRPPDDPFQILTPMDPPTGSNNPDNPNQP